MAKKKKIKFPKDMVHPENVLAENEEFENPPKGSGEPPAEIKDKVVEPGRVIVDEAKQI